MVLVRCGDEHRGSTNLHRSATGASSNPDGNPDPWRVEHYVSDGKVIVEDSFGTGPGQHVPDNKLGGTDDILEFGGKEEEAFTIIEFKRPLKSEDKYDISLVQGIQTIIWAYGLSDDPSLC
ncbi:MAG: hypothetical protein HY529_03310 [Chloroflexi bacterium]|nr:hypothetical protein [Chloroflexota bacterium]